MGTLKLSPKLYLETANANVFKYVVYSEFHLRVKSLSKHQDSGWTNVIKLINLEQWAYTANAATVLTGARNGMLLQNEEL